MKSSARFLRTTNTLSAIREKLNQCADIFQEDVIDKKADTSKATKRQATLELKRTIKNTTATLGSELKIDYTMDSADHRELTKIDDLLELISGYLENTSPTFSDPIEEEIQKLNDVVETLLTKFKRRVDEITLAPLSPSRH